MNPPTRTPTTTASGIRATAARSARIATTLAMGIVPVYVVMAHLLQTELPGTLILLSVLGTFALAYRWNLHHDRAFLVAWLLLALGLALTSALSGLYNGLTDEPAVTPALAQLWPNLYGRSLNIDFLQYGTPLTITHQFDVYLPLIPFLLVPGIDYRWTAVGAWLGTLYLLRRNGTSLVIWGSPWVGLLAANGFNDYVPCLLLTLALLSLRGWAARLAEVLALGVKQFANVVVVAFHLWHRRWGEAVLAAAITVAWLLPFALLSPSGVWCHAVLIESHSCGAAGDSALGLGVITHMNYFVWPLFLLAVLGPGYVRALQGPLYSDARERVAARLARGCPEHTPSPALVLLLTPFARRMRAPPR